MIVYSQSGCDRGQSRFKATTPTLDHTCKYILLTSINKSDELKVLSTYSMCMSESEASCTVHHRSDLLPFTHVSVRSVHKYAFTAT